MVGPPGPAVERARQDSEGVAMADVIFVALTVVVFALLWLAVRAVERL
ncbi:hypothetical protein IMZ11_14455 [Microtetraspora sp. AC03309]|nr:hypothetical protein [Microtetraspora sp. AC03309]MCC5576831.1 hypothetical protein [Microtetraspora sp. AC03309]